MKLARTLAQCTTLIALCAALAAAQVTPLPQAGWMGAWAASAVDLAESPAAVASPDAILRAGQTVRQRVHPTLEGQSVRIRFSNVFGVKPLRIASASVAASTGGSAISVGSLQTLRFDNGRADITIAPGALAWSDAASIAVDPRQPLAVSFRLGSDAPMRTVHHIPLEATWIATGDFVNAPTLGATPPGPWNHIVTGIDVRRDPAAARVVVAFGDSITQGGGNTADLAPGPYPERLAARLREAPVGAEKPGAFPAVAVLNAGIGGNRLLADRTGPSGLSRFDRDVLSQSGVTHVVILIGVNDIGLNIFTRTLPSSLAKQFMVSPEQVIAGLEQLTARARAKGIKVKLGTLLPFKGSGYWSDANEEVRQAINRWIRGRQGVDGVVDFDAALRSKDDPHMLNPAFDSGDHLHPNDAGNAAMASAVDIKELRE